jgi:hypothetical protein
MLWSQATTVAFNRSGRSASTRTSPVVSWAVMTTESESDWTLCLDGDDPVQADMITYLRAIRRRGRYSPVPRILARWATIGYLFESGRVPVVGNAAAADPTAHNLATVQREIVIEEGASAFAFE